MPILAKQLGNDLAAGLGNTEIAAVEIEDMACWSLEKLPDLLECLA
jgi:hypothetical protein